jgi:hypothetical protein
MITAIFIVLKGNVNPVIPSPFAPACMLDAGKFEDK